MVILRVVFLFSLLVLLTVSSAISVVEFCVADFNYPVGPAGYPCKNPANLTVDDFIFSGLGVPGNNSNPFKLGLTYAIDKTFPALNGLGISMLRQDIAVGGVVPIHSHRVSELILVIDGPIVSGFIDGNNVAYYKTLNKGDIMIFPQGLLHFQVNMGDKPEFFALAFVSLNSANPGFQTTTCSLFANDLPSNVIEKITLLDATQVHKMKELFGGSN
ncbi:auxin-binding protein ABP19b-like [Silene latifolia]|uniref:auxin-binding protein ABP19b-like n=1 Tax=Silene latifolia TaxID=37657 RepID=UPI003D77203C